MTPKPAHTERPKPVSPHTMTVTLWVCNALVFACGAAFGAIVL